jgi:hypothetical protein
MTLAIYNSVEGMFLPVLKQCSFKLRKYKWEDSYGFQVIFMTELTKEDVNL